MKTNVLINHWSTTQSTLLNHGEMVGWLADCSLSDDESDPPIEN